MDDKIIISPSILSCDFANMQRDCDMITEAGAQWLHIDVMDGHFVPNITIGAPVVKSLRRVSDAFFDAHLMITDPRKYAPDFCDAGANMITFHVEVEDNVGEVIELIKARGVKVGLVIKPKTPAESVLPYLDRLDMVLVMTVEPGFGGQKFMGDMIPKIEMLSREIADRNLDTLIQVDGGIDSRTAPLVVAAGARVLVAGSALFGAADPVLAVKELFASAREAL